MTSNRPVSEMVERWKGETYLDLSERRNPGADEFAKGFNYGIIEARDLIYARLPNLLAAIPSSVASDDVVDRVAKERADWLLDAIACATQDRRYLRDDPEYDEVAGEAILLNGEKAITTAIAALKASGEE